MEKHLVTSHSRNKNIKSFKQTKNKLTLTLNEGHKLELELDGSIGGKFFFTEKLNIKPKGKIRDVVLLKIGDDEYCCDYVKFKTYYLLIISTTEEMFSLRATHIGYDDCYAHIGLSFYKDNKQLWTSNVRTIEDIVDSSNDLYEED